MARGMTRLTCKFGAPVRKTEIDCGAGVLESAFASRVLDTYSSVRVVVDRRVWRLHEPYIKATLPSGSRVLDLPSGERAKSQTQLQRIWKWLHATETDRKAVLIAVGGGATTDLVGLAASTYMRGIDLILAPTTLLAQVDAAIGGKTAINLQKTKNIIGSFHPAHLVVCDYRFHETLKPAMLREGLIEAVKIFAAVDANAYDRYRKVLPDFRSGTIPERFITDAIRLKCEVVERDPTESGWRKLLNLGHTTGHAYELLSGASHGEGVAYGMIVAAELSRMLLHLAPTIADDLTESVRAIYPRFKATQLSAAEMWSKIAHDKKRNGKDFNFVLLRRLGQHKVVAVGRDDFEQAVSKTQERLSR